METAEDCCSVEQCRAVETAVGGVLMILVYIYICYIANVNANITVYDICNCYVVTSIA